MKEQQFDEMNRVMDSVNKRLTKAVATFVTLVIIAAIGSTLFTSCKKKSPEKCYNCTYYYHYKHGFNIETVDLETKLECGDKAIERIVDSPEYGTFVVNGTLIEAKRTLHKRCK